MSAPDQISGPAPARRALPPGGGAKLRRVYMFMSVIFAASMAPFAIALITAVAAVERGHQDWVHYILASAGATIALFALVVAAVAAALALKGDLADVNALRWAGRLAFFGGAVGGTAGVAAIVFGVVLAVTGDQWSEFFTGLSFDLVVVFMPFLAGSLRRLIRRTAGTG